MKINGLLILNRALDFSVMFPGIFICLMPVEKWLKVSPKKLYPVLTAITLLFCLTFGAVCAIEQLEANFFFIPTMLICIAAYFYKVNLDKLKLLYLFLCAIAALSFGALANDMTEAKLNPYRNMQGYFVYGLLVQYAISFIMLFLFFCIRHKITWLFEYFHSKSVWRIIWIVPVLTTICNFTMLPEKFSTVTVGRIFEIYIIVDSVLFLFFLFFQILFYYIAKASAEKYLAEKTALMYQMQIVQYESLNTYMEQTKRLRHDFRHVMITIRELMEQKQYEELKQYFDRFHLSSLKQTAIYHFCGNKNVNALLSYYAAMAEDEHISIQFQIQLPETSNISDVDFCILFGNLLDNAVRACKTIPQTDRYINLTADTNTPGSLYIAMANSFDGKTKESGGKFLSTKRNSSAVGLSSICTIAEKYHGIAEFTVKNMEFISNVMLRLI